MIHEPSSHTANAVARMVGEVRLQLPQHFRQLLDGAIDEGLPQIPLRSRDELKDIICGQVALTIRAAGLVDFLDAELERQNETEAVQTEAMQFQSLEAIKHKHADAVKGFESVMYNKRSSSKAVTAAHSTLLDSISLIDPIESDPLLAWAKRLMSQRAKLKGAA